MNTQRLIFLILCLWLLPGATQAQFVEGTHYRKLVFAQLVDTGDKIEVREFFWYGCSHCYDLEPTLKGWLKTKPANVKFITTPGAAPRWIVHAKAYYAFETLGIRDKLHTAFFDAIHLQRRQLRDEFSIAEFVAEQGVDKQAFLKAYQSFGVNLQVEQAKNLNKTYGINTVPALVVDGRYVTSVQMAGGNARLFSLLNHLVEKAAKERKRASAKN